MAQAVLSLPTPDSVSRQAQAPSSVQYLPEVYIEHRSSTMIPCLSPSDMTLHAVVDEITRAQHEDVKRVIAFDVESGRCWDASREVARHVLDAILADYTEVPPHCVDFLEEYLGCGVVAAAERQAA